MEALRWILLLAGAVLVGAIYWRGRQQEQAAGGESLFERARRGLSRDGSDVGDSEPGPSRAEPDLGISDDDLRGFDFDASEAATPEPQAEPRPAPEETGSGEPGPTDAAPPDADADGGGDIEAGHGTPAAATGGGEPAAAAGGTEADPGEPAAEPADAGPIRPSAERVVVLFVVATGGERLVGARLLEALEGHGLRHGAHSIFHAGDSEGNTVFSVANAVDPGTFDRSTMDTLSTPGVAFFMQVPGPQAAETAFDRMLRTARGVADALEARVLDEQHSTLTRQTEQHLREELRLIDRRTRQQ